MALFTPVGSHRGTVLQATCFKGHLQAHYDLLCNHREKLNSVGPQTLLGANSIRQWDAERRPMDIVVITMNCLSRDGLISEAIITEGSERQRDLVEFQVQYGEKKNKEGDVKTLK